MILGLESSYSFNGSLIKEEDLLKLNEYNINALGLVDYNSAFFYTFNKLCRSQNIKPVFGIRITGISYDYILYPINNKGYKELIKYISSIDTIIAQNINALLVSENIIYVLEATYASTTDIDSIKKDIDYLMNNNLKALIGVDFSYYPSEELYKNIQDICPTIIIKKVKYIKEKERISSLVFTSILKKEKFDLSNEYSLDSMDEYSFESIKDFDKLYKEYPDLVNRTKSFVDRIDVDINDKGSIPIYKNKDNVESSVYLRALANAGLKKRINNLKIDKKTYQDRLDYELNVINEMGFCDYFLIVYDYILYAKKNNILVGPGRGSAPSSLVAYSLGILDIDPIKYVLYFERFLNKGRVSLPDIDTDIEDIKRDELIKYVENKYGKDHVSLTSVYQTYKAKSILSDVANTIGFDSDKVKSLIKDVPSDNTINSLLEIKRVNNYYQNDNEYRKLIDISKDIENCPQTMTIHPSGVIISKEEMNYYTETHLNKNGFSVTTYDASVIEKLGLLKMDFLSMPTLTFLHNILNDIKKVRGIDLKLNDIPLDDYETFKLIREKSLNGIFQLETTMMSSLAKKMHAYKFSDISICVALDRPGPKDSIESFLRRREKKEKIEYYDKSVENILSDTLGILVYQEQLMAIAKEYAGFDLSMADNLRKAISSKDESKFNEMKDLFYAGASKLNRPLLTTEKIFNDMKKFSGYGLNKSHAVAYSYVPYYLAYLKAHYTNEFLMNYLKNSLNLKSIKECISFNVNISNPNILYSGIDYSIKDNTIYLPYTAIKGVGNDYAKLIEKIANESNKSFEDFVSKSRGLLPRSLIEQMIYSSCFDNGYTKKMMIDSLDGLYEFGQSLFKDYKIKKTNEFSFDYLKEKEYQALGFNLNYHPIKAIKSDLPKVSDLVNDTVGIRIIGYCSNFKEFRTKSGDLMLHLSIEDEFKSVRGILFNKDYMKFKHILQSNRLYTILGTYNLENDEFIIRNIEKINV